MPNGGTWDRFWFTVCGFHERFGRWPTRVVASFPLQPLLTGHLSTDEITRLEAKLRVIEDRYATAPLAAEDESGARYEYRGPTAWSSRGEVESYFGISGIWGKPYQP